MIFIDAEPVNNGHWRIYKNNYIQCSECHRGESPKGNLLDDFKWKTKVYKYCPYCGVKMNPDYYNDDLKDGEEYDI